MALYIMAVSFKECLIPSEDPVCHPGRVMRLPVTHPHERLGDRACTPLYEMMTVVD